MINVCGSQHSHGTAVPVPPMQQGKPWAEAVNAPQRILSVTPSPERAPFFEIDENKSDFLNPHYLAVCLLERNHNYKSDPFPLMSQTRVAGKVTVEVTNFSGSCHPSVVKEGQEISRVLFTFFPPHWVPV